MYNISQQRDIEFEKNIYRFVARNLEGENSFSLQQTKKSVPIQWNPLQKKCEEKSRTYTTAAVYILRLTQIEMTD